MANQTAIITGGNRGIGFHLTQSFVDAGYNVIVGARKEAELKTKLDIVRITCVPMPLYSNLLLSDL